jgi:hypothetical protein
MGVEKRCEGKGKGDLGGEAFYDEARFVFAGEPLYALWAAVTRQENSTACGAARVPLAADSCGHPTFCARLRNPCAAITNQACVTNCKP